MKKDYLILTIIAIIMILLVAAMCQADVYVLKNSNTDEVILISGEDNITNNDGNNEIVILPETISFYNITEEYSLYLLKNKKFSLNTQKITDKEDKKNARIAKNLKDKDSAITAKAKLIVLGFTSDEADYLTR